MRSLRRVARNKKRQTLKFPAVLQVPYRKGWQVDIYVQQVSPQPHMVYSLFYIRPMTMGTRCCKVFFLNYSKKKSDEDTLVPSPWGKREKNICFVQDFPRDRTFVSGRDPAGSRYPGIPRDEIRRGILSTGRYRTGLNHHGIERDNFDGIEISRDCTGRDRDTTGLLGTGLRYHGIARDGIDILRDCTGQDAKTILHGICTVHSKHSVSYDTIALLVPYHTRT